MLFCLQAIVQRPMQLQAVLLCITGQCVFIIIIFFITNFILIGALSFRSPGRGCWSGCWLWSWFLFRCRLRLRLGRWFL